MGTRIIATVAMVALFAGRQAATGSVSGTVADFAGALIGGARVELVSGTGSRTAITDSAGAFRFDGLTAGPYEVSATLVGFLRARKTLVIASGQTATWHPRLRFFHAEVPKGPPDNDPTDAALAKGVYEATVKYVLRNRKPGPLDVNSWTLVVPPMVDMDWPEAAKKFPASLLAALTSDQAQRPVLVRADVLPVGARLISNEDYHSAATAFDPQRPPRLAVTRVFATADGLGAVVVYHFTCGSLCGNATLLWLRRPSPLSRWAVHDTWEFMVS